MQQRARKVQYGVGEKDDEFYSHEPDPEEAEEDQQELLDDPLIEDIMRRSAERLKAETELQALIEDKGTGRYYVVDEGEFLQRAVKAPRCLVHFFKRDFKRCKILDSHLEVLAKFHYETLIVGVDVEKAPFLVERMKIRVLPTMMLLEYGNVAKRYVGFTEFGNEDGFKTRQLEAILIRDRALDAKPAPVRIRAKDDYDDE